MLPVMLLLLTILCCSPAALQMGVNMLPLQQPLAPLPPLPPLPPLQQGMAAPLGLQGSPQPALQPIGLSPGMGLQPQQPVVQVQVQQQQHVVVQTVQPQPDLGLAQGLGMGVGGGPRPLLQQDSFTSEHQRALFKQMSLGIQVCEGCGLGWLGVVHVRGGWLAAAGGAGVQAGALWHRPCVAVRSDGRSGITAW